MMYPFLARRIAGSTTNTINETEMTTEHQNLLAEHEQGPTHSPQKYPVQKVRSRSREATDINMCTLASLMLTNSKVPPTP
jgi:hypothetical protein